MEEILEGVELVQLDNPEYYGEVGQLTDWLDDAEYTLDELIGKYGKPEVWKGGKERVVKRDSRGRFVRWYKVGER